MGVGTHLYILENHLVASGDRMVNLGQAAFLLVGKNGVVEGFDDILVEYVQFLVILMQGKMVVCIE